MAKEHRSDDAFANLHKATEAFDYFVCSVAGAIFAYIVKDYSPQKLALDFSILTPLSLLFLSVAFFSGLKRIESTVTCSRFNALKLDAAEKAQQMSTILVNPAGVPYAAQTGQIETFESVEKKRDHFIETRVEADKHLQTAARRAQRYYRVRNSFLLLGFATILAAKIAQPYECKSITLGTTNTIKAQ